MKQNNKDFLYAKMRIKNSNNAKKELSSYEKSITKSKYKGKNFLDYSLINNGILNNWSKEEEKLLILKKNITDIKQNNKAKKNKKLIDNELENLNKKLKKQKEITNKEYKQLKKEIKEINILNNNAKGKIKLANNENDIITLRGVSKLYSTKSSIFKGLDNIDVSIKKGTFNVILGPSGSGKTTLLNMISGLDRNTIGEVIVNNINIQALSDAQMTLFRREKLGFVFQSYNLLSSLNVQDNVEVGRALQNNANKRMDIKTLLDDMDMGINRKKMTYELSGGQQQRVSIARALSKTPDILIGDEPTGALDQETSKKVFGLFQNANKKNNTTIIIVTHNPNVAKLADLVIKVKDGKINKLIHNLKPLNAKDLKEV